jgi:hypothetical protein
MSFLPPCPVMEGGGELGGELGGDRKETVIGRREVEGDGPGTGEVVLSHRPLLTASFSDCFK